MSLRNSRYPETGRVLLFRSAPQGYQLVGDTTLLDPVRAGKRTTDVKFSYTFRRTMQMPAK